MAPAATGRNPVWNRVNPDPSVFRSIEWTTIVSMARSPDHNPANTTQANSAPAAMLKSVPPCCGCPSRILSMHSTSAREALDRGELQHEQSLTPQADDRASERGARE
jgi:hypothetical protein